jgi:hypothetical protein
MLKTLRKIRKKVHKYSGLHTHIRHYLFFKKLPSGDYFVANNVKYYCQFASPELTRGILEKRMPAEKDPRWREFGFEKPEDYEFWSWRACGIVCMKMIIETLCNIDKSVKDLLDEGIQLGGYVAYDENGKLVDKGWYYNALIKLAEKYNLNGKLFSYLSIKHICKEILDKHFVVASVDPGLIRYDKVKSNFTGGHVVLIYGFKWENGNCSGFYMHNPSGKEEKTRVAYIPLNDFKKAFAERGFSIWS